MNDIKPLWTPSQASIDAANMTRFIARINERHGLGLSDYDGLYQWSIDSKEDFWSEVWDFCGIIGDKGERILVDGEDIERACWFPDARLNFAENLLRRRDEETAIFFRAEDQVEYRLSYAEVYRQTASLADWLRANGLQPGDRVAGYLPNMPEAVIAMLAATSIGAIWTSTSPDFGVESVIDRFGQTEPRFLFSVDGYFYNGKRHDMNDKVREIRAQLPSVEQTVLIDLAGFGNHVDALDWREVTNRPVNEIEFVARGFNDPLYILYSSGTTGKPKCITHKVGGTLIQQIKEQVLHCDVHPGDRVFYFTTLGWMMWNWLVDALACEAALVLYDGSPFYPDGEVLWRYADDVGMTLFGTSAKYIDALKNADLKPMANFDLQALRCVASTGSVLAPESFDYVYVNIKQDVCLASISGGTDIASCFVLSCPLLPVYRGEIQCRGLGMAIDVFDDQGQSLTNRKGELVCTQTFPSQPVYFWGDAGRQQVSRRLLRAFRKHLASRRLRDADRSRRHRDLRPFGRHAESRRRAHRHRRNLPPRRAARRGDRKYRHRPGLGRRRARGTVRGSASGPQPGRRTGRPNPQNRARKMHPPPHPGEDRPGGRNPAHQVRQDRRTGGTRRGA